VSGYAYLLFTTTMVLGGHGNSANTAVASNATHVESKADCMQGVKDFIGQSNFKLMGNEGSSQIEVAGRTIVKMATCSISEGDS